MFNPDQFYFELLDKYTYGAKQGILVILQILKEHENEKSVYTVKELETFMLAVANKL